jgi:hypothetical protein
MRRLAAALLGAAAIAGGCGSAHLAGQATGTASGSGGAIATASSTGGSGGVPSGTGTFTMPMCNDPTVFVDILGDGPAQHIDASCAPEGSLLSAHGGRPPPPPPPMGSLGIVACPKAAAYVLELEAAGLWWPASTTFVTVRYQHGGAVYTAMDGSFTVTTFGPVGGLVEGSFSATVMPPAGDDAGAPIMISGKFRVCRTPDLNPV